jgi:hypothetical protein
MHTNSDFAELLIHAIALPPFKVEATLVIFIYVNEALVSDRAVTSI